MFNIGQNRVIRISEIQEKDISLKLNESSISQFNSTNISTLCKVNPSEHISSSILSKFFAFSVWKPFFQELYGYEFIPKEFSFLTNTDFEELNVDHTLSNMKEVIRVSNSGGKFIKTKSLLHPIKILHNNGKLSSVTRG